MDRIAESAARIVIAVTVVVLFVVNSVLAFELLLN